MKEEKIKKEKEKELEVSCRELFGFLPDYTEIKKTVKESRDK